MNISQVVELVPVGTEVAILAGADVSQLRRRMELAPPITVTFPTRWTVERGTDHGETVQEIARLAKVLVAGCEAIAGTYMRLCDTIRESSLTDEEIRAALARHFPQSRVSEILRVSRAPDEIYRRYTAGFFGFKAALRECRLYNVTPSNELTRRKVRRAAARLVALLKEPGSVRVKDSVVTIERLTPFVPRSKTAP